MWCFAASIFNGNTTVGNLKSSSLSEVFSSGTVKEIVDGFRRFRVVHPYCRKCLGSSSVAGWLMKPPGQILSLKVLKPFFYKKTALWK
jgi:hypothetical protein